MPQIKVTLDIGYPTATHRDVIDINDEEWNACENDHQREDLMHEYWQDWANDYINGWYELVE